MSFISFTFLQGVKGERGFPGPMGDKGDEVSNTNESRIIRVHGSHFDIEEGVDSKDSGMSASPDRRPMLKVCFQRKPLKLSTALPVLLFTPTTCLLKYPD